MPPEWKRTLEILEEYGLRVLQRRPTEELPPSRTRESSMKSSDAAAVNSSSPTESLSVPLLLFQALVCGASAGVSYYCLKEHQRGRQGSLTQNSGKFSKNGDRCVHSILEVLGNLQEEIEKELNKLFHRVSVAAQRTQHFVLYQMLHPTLSHALLWLEHHKTKEIKPMDCEGTMETPSRKADNGSALNSMVAPACSLAGVGIMMMWGNATTGRQQRGNDVRSSLLLFSAASTVVWWGMNTLLNKNNDCSKKKHADDGDDYDSDDTPKHRNLKSCFHRSSTSSLESDEESSSNLREHYQPLPPLPPALTTTSTPSTITTANSSSTKSNSNKQRYLEIMVHNVSHTDMVLGLQNHNNNNEQDDDSASGIYFARPRFSCVAQYSRRIRQALADTNINHNSMEQRSATIVYVPRHERNDQAPRFSIQPDSTDTLAAGVEFASGRDGGDGDDNSNKATIMADLKHVKVRGVDQARLDKTLPPTELPIKRVYFPLVATLLPRWRQTIHSKGLSTTATDHSNGKQTCKRVLILVSGVGTPRCDSHSLDGNSTHTCAELLQHFLQRFVDPDLTVVVLHDNRNNVFRYDENLVFVQEKLLPLLDAYRDAHARGLPYPDEVDSSQQLHKVLPEFDTEWRKTMSVSLSFADGTQARTYAIQSSLRPYRPMYYHFWQLKTFWHEAKLVDSDIEVHSFEEMDASPALAVDKVQDECQRRVIAEIQAFQSEMVTTLHSGTETNDLQRFWLRKTHKPVLAVLLIRKPRGTASSRRGHSDSDADEFKLYRGTNMEVSMPTGSLCAERNVIGSALADYPNLRRQDLLMIAVLAVPVYKQVLPVPASSSASLKIGAVSIDAGQVQQSTSSLSANLESSTTSLADQTPSSEPLILAEPAAVMLDDTTASRRKTSIGSEQEEWILSPPPAAVPTPPMTSPSHANATMTKGFKSDTDLKSYDVVASGDGNASDTQPSTPARRVALWSARKSKRTVVIQSTRDLNPLAPCGACNEWLKKISESNPSFMVLTFTDADCHGVYCTPCQE